LEESARSQQIYAGKASAVQNESMAPVRHFGASRLQILGFVALAFGVDGPDAAGVGRLPISQPIQPNTQTKQLYAAFVYCVAVHHITRA